MIFKQNTITSLFKENDYPIQPFKNAEKIISKYNQAIENNSLTQRTWERLLSQSDDTLKNYLTNIKGSTGSMSGYNISLQGSFTGLKKVHSAIAKYNSLSSEGKSEQASFVKVISASNTGLGKYLSGLNGSKATMSDYISSLIGAKVATIGLQIATAALNAAITMGISFAIQGLIELLSSANRAREEETEKIKETMEAEKEAIEETKLLADEANNLTEKIIDSVSAYANAEKSTIDYSNAIKSLVNDLDIEKSKIQELIDKYLEFDEAVAQSVISKLGTYELDLRANYDIAKQEALQSNTNDVVGNYNSVSGIKTEGNKKIEEEVLAAKSALYVLPEEYALSFDKTNIITSDDIENNQYEKAEGYYIYLAKIPKELEEAYGNMAGIIAKYEAYQESLKILSDTVGADNVVYKEMYEDYCALREPVNNYLASIKELNQNLAIQMVLNSKANGEAQKTLDEFINAAVASKQFVGSIKDIEDAFSVVLGEYNFDNTTTVALSALENASNGISLLSKAFKELSDDGYISISTISSIQEATGLSGDAWKEYENNLLSAKAGTEEFNNILGKLTYRILENKLGTEDLTNATEAQIATILRENGVLNSAAIAQDLLASKKNNTIFDSSKIVFADTSNDTGDFTTEPYRESDGYFKYAEDLYKAHQNESQYINDLQWGLDNLVKSEEERLEILDKINQSAHNQVSNLEHQIQMKKNAEGDDADVRGYYQDIQKIAHAEAERLRNQGYDDSNANIKEWQNIWWDAQSKIVEANEKIIASIDETVAEANELLDGFQNVYTTLTDVAKEYNTNGYLSADSLQSILELGPKYLDYLYDENGQLVVNKEALENIIAAQTEEMAVQAALAYSKQILAAAEKGDIQALTNLTQVTANSSDATWDMAYATIALAKAIGTANGMDASYFDDAYSSIVKMQDMTELAVNSMSKYYDTLEEGYISEKDGLDKILELTQEMIKWENEQKIEALENEKKAYQDIINKKKEMLQLAKEESEHEDSIAEKIKEIAELQSKIEQLSLDDSREAQAQKKGLEEELGELQKELADEQSDYAVDAQIDALDRELEEFELAKDKEIAEQEAMLDSTEELYQAAIERIDTDWDGLYFDLLAWNAQYGSSLESDIVAAWHAASAAVQEYGSFVAASAAVSAGGSSSSGGSSASSSDASAIKAAMKENSYAWFTADEDKRDVLEAENADLAKDWSKITGETLEPVEGKWLREDRTPLYTLSQNDVAGYIVAQMKANYNALKRASGAAKDKLEEENDRLAKTLEDYLGKDVWLSDKDGLWYIGNDDLFEKYHSGGVAGNNPTLRQEEVMALLEDGEVILDSGRQNTLYNLVDFANVLSQRLDDSSDLTNLTGTFMPTFATAGVTGLPLYNSVNNREQFNFNPEININIEHSGALGEGDMKRYGEIAANSALDKLSETFYKRGISNMGGAMLR